MTSGERILVGRIASAHGLKGEVKIATFTAAPEGIAAYGPLETSTGGTVTIRSARAISAGSVIAAIEGVTDRTAAEKMAGCDLYVSREQLPATEDDGEFYHADLIGLAAFSPDGTPLGTVTAVHNFGACDLLELAVAGASGGTELIPFTEEHVPSVDLAGGRIVIVLPEDDEAMEGDRGT
jgi:16S rRNA processing protein RimM